MLYYKASSLLVFLVSFSLIPACLAQQAADVPLVAGQILHEAGLDQLWQTKLAIREHERVEKVMLLGDKIYALTSTNYLFCLNRTGGALVFGMQLAPEGFPILEPQLCQNRLLVVAGNKLIQIDAATSAVTYTQKFDYTIVCPMVRNRENLYVAGVDKRIHAIAMADRVQLYEVAADNDSTPTSVLADNEHVLFATDKGNVICMRADKPERLWQYDAAEKITAPIVRDGNDVYVACWDTRLYKLKASTGRPSWKYQLGGILKNSPRVTQAVAYQPVAERGVTAVDKESGKPLWTADDGVDLLAEINGKAYILTKDQTTAVIDNTTHKRLFAMNFAQVSLHAVNTIDGRIYVADRNGRVACIAAEK